MYYYNYSYEQRENSSSSDENFVLGDNFTSTIFWNDRDVKNKHEWEVNFELEVSYSPGLKAPHVFFEPKNLDTNKLIKGYTLRINSKEVGRFVTNKKALIDFNNTVKEFTKEAENLKNLEIAFLNDELKEVGQYIILYDKVNKNSDKRVLTSNKTQKIKKPFAYVYFLNNGKLTIQRKYFHIIFLWNDIVKNTKITQIGSMVYYSDPLRKEIKELFAKSDDIQLLVENPYFRMPNVIEKDPNIAISTKAQVDDDSVWTVTFHIDDYLAPDYINGTIVKSSSSINAKKVLEIPEKVTPRYEYVLSFHLFNDLVSVYNNGEKNPEDQPKPDKSRYLEIVESERVLEREYSYKITLEEINNMHFNRSTEWTIEDYQIRKRRNE